MANRHCGRYGCVLAPEHRAYGTFCVNLAGARVGLNNAATYSEKGRKFQAAVVGDIRASLSSEFSQADRNALGPVIEAASRADRYILRHVWDQVHKQLRDTVRPTDKAHFLTTCLAYHGIDIKETNQ